VSARPVWLGPALALATLSILLALVLHSVSGGREVGDDAPRLVSLAEHPFALFGEYEKVGISPNFGSYPPLLPALFGTLVRPWLAISSDFWGIRMGAFAWSLVLLLLIPVVARAVRASATETHRALWLFALLPTVWGAIALIPQEESYVAVYSVGLFLAATTGPGWLLAPLFLLTVLAGKYFLLILAVPLAVFSTHPSRNLVLWVIPSLVALGAYVAYHALTFDHPTPILGHQAGFGGGTFSVWLLLWEAGLQPNLQLVKATSVAITGSCVLGFCLLARRRGFDLLSTVAASLYITLVTLYLSLPGYVLWVLPLMAVRVSMMRERGRRWSAAALMVLWGFSEWGANFFRGAAYALQVERGAGKAAVADAAARVLGADFPYHPTFLALALLVPLCGIALVALLWLDASQRAPESAPGRG
jgi:hypothetical protein